MEYQPTEAQEALAIERYKKHQRKMKWIPLYRHLHKRHTHKKMRAVHSHYIEKKLTKTQVYNAIAQFGVMSKPTDDPELRYWQGYADAQRDITEAIKKL